METVTIVDLGDRTEIQHVHNFASDSVTLLFRDRGELSVTCSPEAWSRLAGAVAAAGRALEDESHGAPEP